MLRYILQRLLAAFPVLFVILVFSFVLVHLAPGDPAVLLAGHLATPAEVEKLRLALGLKQPLPVQFLLWLQRLTHGDLGRSVVYNEPLSTLLAQRFPTTASLALPSVTLAILVGIPLGVLAAWRWRTWHDRAVMVFAVLGFAVPSFWLAYNLIFIFSLHLHWFPPTGYRSIRSGLIPYLSYIFLPALTDSLVVSALLARMTRAALLEVVRSDYIRTARAKGLPERIVVIRHAVRSAAIPVVTVVGISIANVMTGSIIVETVFSIPGMGRLFVEAANDRDYPVIQATVLLSGIVFVLVNLIIDVSYALLDPRIRYS